MGGLSSAIYLSCAGWDIDVFEKNSAPGGKAWERHLDATQGRFRWDNGPSLLTMPHVLDDIFNYCGEKMETALPLLKIKPACRYFWTDGTVLDEDDSFWQRDDVRKYLAHAKGIYDLSGDCYLTRPPSQWWRAMLEPHLWKALEHLPKVATLRTLSEINGEFFKDRKLLQIFNRFATYNGSSPWLTPATFAIIPYVEATFGAWYPQGGMARIAESLWHLAEKRGVRFHFNSEKRDLAALAQSADACICNGDIITAHTHWLRDARRAKHFQSRQLSSSACILQIAVAKTFPQLSHHNLFFSDKYEQEFEEIFTEKKMPSEPTLYLAITSKSDPTDAPKNCENWFVLANAPAYSQVQTKGYERVVFQQLERHGIRLSPSDVISCHLSSPRDLASHSHAWEGALYGWASHSPTTSFLRPPMRHHSIKNLYFAGGTTHPGGGVPLALLSGKMAAEQIKRNHART